MVLICISLVTNDVVHVFHVPVGLWYIFCAVSFQVFCSVLIGSFVLLMLCNSLPDIYIVNIFFQFVVSVAVFFMVSFDKQKF